MVRVSTRNRRRNNTSERILFSKEARAIAREALEDLGEGDVGDHLGVSSPQPGEDVATSGAMAIHRFRCSAPGYRGWEWIAVLATVPGSGEITVNEVALQAGKKATLAPEWVPYENRVRPGDLGPGDRLPPRRDDERLAEWKDLGGNDGFPRNPRSKLTLSRVGLQESLQRWRQGEYGPTSEFAEKSTAKCKTCAFYLPINDVETHMGVCTNEFSADGHVVQESYGCGAHSDTQEETLSTSNKDYGVFDDGM